MYCSTGFPIWPVFLRLPVGLALFLAVSVLLCGALHDWPPDWELPAVPTALGHWRWRQVRYRRVASQVYGYVRAQGPRLVVRCAWLAVWLHLSGWGQRTPVVWHLLWVPLSHPLLLLLALSGRRWACRWAGYAARLYQVLLVYLAFSAVCHWQRGPEPGTATPGWPLFLGAWCSPPDDETHIRVTLRADQSLQVSLRGSFVLDWQPRDRFERWMLVLWLRHLRRPEQTRPCLSQFQVADACGVSSQMVSRWEREVRQHGWHVLSDRYRHQVHSLLPDAPTSRRILQVWVPAFWLSAWEVREQLIAGGVLPNRAALDLEALHALAQHTGFAQVRQLLLERFQLQGGQLIAREHWWLREQQALNERLLERLALRSGPHTQAQAQALTPQATLDIAALRLPPPAPAAETLATPGLAPTLQQVLFPAPDAPSTQPVRCTYCGSDQVAPKSKQARLKTVLDQCGNARQIAVLRYYCHNSACAVRSFTHLPAGYLPHSPYPLPTRLLGLEVYVHLLSTYRRAARLLGVRAPTLYRWLTALGPVAAALAAYLGVIRTSGVVGIDDKWVRVCSPSAILPHGRRPRAVWRFAYFAVDAHSYDLLALELYPQHNDHAVRLFLLELKAKGLTPRVVVTDLDPAYERMLPLVFPQAVHHECIFHAIQNALRQLTQVYGRYYRENNPTAAQLHDAIVHLFRARTQKTVRKRFKQLLASRDTYLTHTPAVACVFDSLERHFPKLINAVENPLIPRTNNVTELVIRRFDQHYQSMGGFDSLESARVYLRLFELVYRLTPFADDNPGPLCGRSPLQIAGYDLHALPIADFFSQLKLPTLASPSQEVVPML